MTKIGKSGLRIGALCFLLGVAVALLVQQMDGFDFVLDPRGEPPYGNYRNCEDGPGPNLRFENDKSKVGPTIPKSRQVPGPSQFVDQPSPVMPANGKSDKLAAGDKRQETNESSPLESEKAALLARYERTMSVDPYVRQILETLTPRQRLKMYDTLGTYQGEIDQLQSDMKRLEVDKDRLEANLEEPGEATNPEDAADKGEVRFSLNESGVSDEPLEKSLVEDLGLNAEESNAVEEMLRGQTDSLHDGLQGLLAELTGDPDAGTGYNVIALIEAIREGTSRADFSSAIDLIAQEVAGQATRPEDSSQGSVAQRMLRAAVDHDASVRKALEELLGPELAAAFMDHESNKGTFYSFDASGGQFSE